MSGRSRRRRRHRRDQSPPRPPCADESTQREPATVREIAVADRPSKKTCQASSSTSATTSGPDVWADLLDSLLHQIIPLLSSFHDLLGFIGTCRSWRAALSSLPPAFIFNFPPLHLRPDDGPCHHRRSYFDFKYTSLSSCRWRLTDPAKRTSSLLCSAPQNLQVRMGYLGCSYGYLMFSNTEQCILVDAYCGAVVRPPKLKSIRNQEICYGFLIAALNAPNSQLLLFSRSSVFQWQVGSNSWLDHHHPFAGDSILQMVSFKGVIFAMDFFERLHRVCLEPQFCMQQVAAVSEEDMVAGCNFKPWLVVCGDMLLLVHLSVSIGTDCLSGTFKIFCLDMSVEPAKWVKVENLGNCSLFVSFDRRNPTFCSKSPERWGGKSNCIYVASGSEDSDEDWTMFELGQVVPSTVLRSACNLKSIQTPSGHGNHLQNLWVLPSFLYGIGQ